MDIWNKKFTLQEIEEKVKELKKEVFTREYLNYYQCDTVFGIGKKRVRCSEKSVIFLSDENTNLCEGCYKRYKQIESKMDKKCINYFEKSYEVLCEQGNFVRTSEFF